MWGAIRDGLALIGFVTVGLLTCMFIWPHREDYVIEAPEAPDDGAYVDAEGGAALVYHYDAETWEVVARVDDRLVLRRRTR